MDGPSGAAGIKAAKDFAKDCGCTFLFDADKYEICFGRVANKKDA